MFIQQGKTNWIMIIFVALIAGAVGGVSSVYINDTIRQTTELSQVAELKKPENKGLTSGYGTDISTTNILFKNGNAQAILEKIMKGSGLDGPTVNGGNMMRWTVSRESNVYEVELWGKVLNFIAVEPEILARVKNDFVDSGFAIDPVSTYRLAGLVGNKDGYRKQDTVCNLISGLTVAYFAEEPEPGLIDVTIECGDLAANDGVAYPVNPERTKMVAKGCVPLNEPSPDFCKYGSTTIKLDGNNCGVGYTCASLTLDAGIGCPEKCKANGYVFGDCYKAETVSTGRIMGQADCPQYKYSFSYAQDNFNCWCHNEPNKQ